MPHDAKRRQQVSVPVIAPLLFAIAAMSLFAIVWRRSAAPRFVARVRPSHETATPSADAITADTGDTQRVDSGTGALTHRQYDVTLPLNGRSPGDLMRLMQRHIADLSPSALADFQKTEGSDLAIQVGDEYDITMLGPWNGRVRVAEVAVDSFTLVTLEGHPEAGHITFSAQRSTTVEGMATVLIESFARSRDGMVNLAYDTLVIGKHVQAEVWITFLQRFGALAGVTDTPQVRVRTESIADSDATRAAAHYAP
jgi:Domain of unknown function (DUF1990)